MDCARAAIREFLAPLGISQTRLALDLHVPAPRINAIVRGKRAITAGTAPAEAGHVLASCRQILAFS